MADIWEILKKQNELKEEEIEVESTDEIKDPFFEEEIKKIADNL